MWTPAEKEEPHHNLQQQFGGCQKMKEIAR
jgi:hypothetical protein